MRSNPGKPTPCCPRGRLAKTVESLIVGVAMVNRHFRRALERRDDMGRGRQVRVTNPQTDDIDALLLDFPLQLIDLREEIGW